MKKLTLRDIDRVCDMAVDITGSHHPDDAEQEREEIKRIRSQMKIVLRFARGISEGDFCAVTPDMLETLPL